VILAYPEDGPDLVLMAMSGRAGPAPAWWLNLQAHPEVIVDLPGGSTREVAAREAHGKERSRLWARWEGVSKDLGADATRRTNTPLIVLEPRPGRGA
jgi:F420H(2)-dependent quinone reductase